MESLATRDLLRRPIRAIRFSVEYDLHFQYWSFSLELLFDLELLSEFKSLIRSQISISCHSTIRSWITIRSQIFSRGQISIGSRINIRNRLQFVLCWIYYSDLLLLDRILVAILTVFWLLSLIRHLMITWLLTEIRQWLRIVIWLLIIIWLIRSNRERIVFRLFIVIYNQTITIKTSILETKLIFN